MVCFGGSHQGVPKVAVDLYRGRSDSPPGPNVLQPHIRSIDVCHVGGTDFYGYLVGRPIQTCHGFDPGSASLYLARFGAWR